MADQLAFLLFGDQFVDVHECLADFFRRENDRVLSDSFLKQTSSALEEEVDRLSNIERQRIPTFNTIQELNEKYDRQSQKTSALDSALVCITQLLLYIE